MFRTSNDNNVRQTMAGLKRRAGVSDWCGVVKFAILAAVMTTLVILTGSAEAAVVVGSSLGTLLRR